MLEKIPSQICLERSGSRRKKSTKYLASYLNSRCVSGGTCPLFKRLDSSNGLQIIARNRPTGGSGNRLPWRRQIRDRSLAVGLLFGEGPLLSFLAIKLGERMSPKEFLIDGFL
ncbi:hypothetical protein CEXT_337111 [Caerostris extrusa]|uniref:Uncharacterized protein n=1 Tax=Caerostris extrusa TaxID=172846 RepID=A0AAV4MQI0_CAEEX|nr:hypothetical protein CEXT_337111 [Caerostris extrusa]